ncbi:hypothetical protein [Sphingobacterium anhuiense]|uniref:Uncharacterized protein n=1 Tax=Sphingobacterium anhuiense TaxID=493780 RepID=A0ABW5YUS0_9SPHI
MKTQKENWFIRNLKDIRETIFGFNTTDSTLKRASKVMGWYMFLTLMTCGIAATLIAISFAH